MFQRLLFIGVAAILAASAKAAVPSEFYVVSVFFSDNCALFYYRILDVKQEGVDSLVRYVRIGPRSVSCPREIVQAVEARVANTTPAQLVEKNNPCAPKSVALKAAIKKYAQRAGVLETISFGVLAQCDGVPVSLSLPRTESVKWKSLKGAHPEMAHLWDLSSEVTDRVFGSKDIFRDRTEEDDLALQHAGEKLVPELVAGRYDAGLAAAFHANVERSDDLSFRSLLEDYGGPMSITQAKDVPRLLKPEHYQFSRFIAPNYPPLAVQARIQGKVELQLTVDQASGEVHGVALVSGHPLFKDSAIAAAKLWRFTPNSATSENVNVTLDYSLQCPVCVNTTNYF
jgi:TonB family protein